MKKSCNSPFVTNVLALLNASAQVVLTPAATHLYTALLAMQNRRGWTEWLSMSDRQMAACTGMTARAVARSRVELEAASLIVCRQTGTGSQSRWEYRLGAWRAPDARSDAAVVQNSSADTSFKGKEETEDREKEEEERTLSLEELHLHMKANGQWRGSFSSGNGMSEATLDEHIRLFLRMLANTGVRGKTVTDAYNHFGHWYNRRLMMRLQLEQQQQEAERRRLEQLEEERRQQLLRKEQMEQESVQTWLRIRDEMIQKAAAGDPHAIRVMEQFKDIIDDTPTPKAQHE